MGNKSSKKSSERQQVSSKQENQVDYESPVKNQIDKNSSSFTPLKNYDDDIDAKSQSLPSRCESPMKRAQHVIHKHGFFGTIRRKMHNTPSLFRKLSRRTPNSAKPTVSQTKLGIPDPNLKTKLQSNSAQSTPIKPSNRSLGEQIQTLSHHRSNGYLDVSREIVLDSDKFNETIDDYTLRAVESTNEELLNNKIESGQDIMQNSINLEILNIARDIVENTFIGAFSEMQRLVDTDEIDNELRTCLINEAAKNLILSKSNASLSEDQYSGQLSSRNNTPAKIRKLSENQQIFSAQSPLVKQLENEELEFADSDVESPNEPKIFEHEAKATESREFLAKTSETVETAEPVETIKPVETNDTTRTASETVIFQNSFVYTETSAESIPTTNQKKSTVQSIITPAVKPENVNMHDISEWSLDESRELIPRPSVRDDLSRTTLE